MHRQHFAIYAAVYGDNKTSELCLCLLCFHASDQIYISELHTLLSVFLEFHKEH